VASPRPKWPHPSRPDARLLLGPGLICFDTMMLTSLVRANKTQLLFESMRTRARMPERVCGELRGHARETPEITRVLPPAFGQSVKLDRAAALRASVQQRAWNSDAEIQANPHKDRGEAECLELCKEHGWPLMTQDHKAVRTGPRRGVVVFGMPELLMVMVAEERLLAVSAWKIYEVVRAGGLPKADGWPLTDEGRDRFLRCCEEMHATPPSR